jgi:hypothetical protein
VKNSNLFFKGRPESTMICMHFVLHIFFLVNPANSGEKKQCPFHHDNVSSMEKELLHTIDYHKYIKEDWTYPHLYYYATIFMHIFINFSLSLSLSLSLSPHIYIYAEAGMWVWYLSVMLMWAIAAFWLQLHIVEPHALIISLTCTMSFVYVINDYNP